MILYSTFFFCMLENTDVHRHGEYWRKRDVAGLCQVGVRTVENWMSHEGLPHLKIGNVVLFKPQDVRTFLEQKRRIVGDYS